DAAWIANWQHALGVHLRMVARPAPRMVSSIAGNLLTGEFAASKKGSGLSAMVKPVAMLLALIGCLQLAFIVIDAWQLDQRRQSLEREMIQVFKDAFPQAQAIVDPPLQMQRNLDAMKRARGLGSADDARLLLAQLTSILSVAPTLVPQRVTLADGIASIDVAVTDQQMQSALKARAAALPGMTFVVDADNVVRLSMKATR
ncbi:MAG: type II secretion system protein GspL, partial [Betaproteobacteria bacterium]